MKNSNRVFLNKIRMQRREENMEFEKQKIKPVADVLSLSKGKLG